MSWQSHFSFTFTISGQFGKPTHFEQSLDVKSDIPMEELFASQFTGDTRELSLNHRKILWTYQHVPKSAWSKAVRELAKQIQEHPSSSLTIKTSHAGVAVVLAMLANSKLCGDKKLHFQFQEAPLSWLEKHFAPMKGAHTVEFSKSATWPSRRAA